MGNPGTMVSIEEADVSGENAKQNQKASGKHTENDGKTPCLIGKSTYINYKRPCSKANCQFTRGYIQDRTKMDLSQQNSSKHGNRTEVRGFRQESCTHLPWVTSPGTGVIPSIPNASLLCSEISLAHALGTFRFKPMWKLRKLISNVLKNCWLMITWSYTLQYLLLNMKKYDISSFT